MTRISVAFALVLLATPAAAGLAVCNHTAQPAKLALGRFNGTHWMSEGWWKIAGHRCAKLISSPLDARYYYLYATDGGPGSWDGSRAFCVSNSDSFKVVGRADCAGRGFDSKGFFEVDTGSKTDYTQSLSD